MLLKKYPITLKLQKIHGLSLLLFLQESHKKTKISCKFVLQID